MGEIDKRELDKEITREPDSYEEEPREEIIRRGPHAIWQSNNCSRCKFGDQSKVGTGEPCCTYPGTIKVVGAICWQRQDLEEQ